MKTLRKSDDLTVLIENSTNSRRKKILKKMFVILNFIEQSEITDEQEKSLQNELQEYPLLELDQISPRKLNKRFRKFQRFTNIQFDIRHKGFYTTYYLSVGMTLGLAIGSAVFKVSIGLSTGMMIGLFLGMLYGRIKDQKAEKENRVYDFRQ